MIEAKGHTAARYFGSRSLKDTLPIYRRGPIENSIDASKVVGRDQAPLALGGSEKVASHDVAGPGIRRANVKAPTSALSNSDRRGVVVSSTRGARRNIDAMDPVEGEFRCVDLSAMEHRVLDLMRLGKTTKEIAAMLCIPERTVELHIRHSLRRLRARSGEELLSLIGGYH